MDVHEEAIAGLIPTFGNYEAARAAYQKALGEVRAERGMPAVAVAPRTVTVPSGPTEADRLSAARQAVAQANPSWSSASIDNAARRSISAADMLAARDAVLNYPDDKLRQEFEGEVQARNDANWAQHSSEDLT